jgi:hypothetical protein
MQCCDQGSGDCMLYVSSCMLAGYSSLGYSNYTMLAGWLALGLPKDPPLHVSTAIVICVIPGCPEVWYGSVESVSGTTAVSQSGSHRGPGWPSRPT